MSKNRNKKAEAPEVEQPAFVDVLKEKGAVALTGRSQGELDEMIAKIPSDLNFYTGAVCYHIGKGLYRVQVNLK